MLRWRKKLESLLCSFYWTLGEGELGWVSPACLRGKDRKCLLGGSDLFDAAVPELSRIQAKESSKLFCRRRDESFNIGAQRSEIGDN